MKSDSQMVNLNTFRRTISFTDRWQAACSESGRSEADLDIEGHPADQAMTGTDEDDVAAQNQHLVQNCYLSEVEPDQTDAAAVDMDMDCDKSTEGHKEKRPVPEEDGAPSERGRSRKYMNQKQAVLTSGEALLDGGAGVKSRRNLLDELQGRLVSIPSICSRDKDWGISWFQREDKIPHNGRS